MKKSYLIPIVFIILIAIAYYFVNEKGKTLSRVDMLHLDIGRLK